MSCLSVILTLLYCNSTGKKILNELSRHASLTLWRFLSNQWTHLNFWEKCYFKLTRINYIYNHQKYFSTCVTYEAGTKANPWRPDPPESRVVPGGRPAMLATFELAGLIWATDDPVEIFGVDTRIATCWFGAAGNKIRWTVCVVWGFEVTFGRKNKQKRWQYCMQSISVISLKL